MQFVINHYPVNQKLFLETGLWEGKEKVWKFFFSLLQLNLFKYKINICPEFSIKSIFFSSLKNPFPLIIYVHKSYRLSLGSGILSF